MWLHWPRAPFQDAIRLVPDGDVTGWDNPPYDSSYPQEYQRADVQLGWFDSLRYSWKGTLKSTQPFIGAIHVAFGMNDSFPRATSTPDGFVPPYVAHGTTADSLSITLGNRFTIQVRRYAANLWPNGGRPEERATYGGKYPYVSQLLNPPVAEEYTRVPSVRVGNHANCTQVRLLVDGSERKAAITPFMVQPIAFAAEYPVNDQQVVLSSAFCSVGLGVVKNTDEHRLYTFVSFGGFGARAITWTHDIADSNEDYMNEPVRLISSNGVAAYVAAAKSGQFTRSQPMRPDESALAETRYLKTFAAYRNAAENFAWPLASDSANGIADVDCAGHVAILKSGSAGQSSGTRTDNLLLPHAVHGYDLSDTAFIAETGRTSNVSAADSENVLLSKIEVSIPGGFLTSPSNLGYATFSQTPSPSATLTLEPAAINNYYIGEADFNWTYTQSQGGNITPISIHKKLKALCFLERRFEVSNRRASNIGAAVFSSVTKLHLRLAFGGVPATGPQPPGDVVLLDLQEYRDLTNAEQSALFSGQAVTLARWDFGERIKGFRPFNGTNLTATVRAVGTPPA